MRTSLKFFLAGPACLAAVILSAQQPNSQPAGNASRGESLFFGKAGCATCHEVMGRGGVTAPELSAVGERSPDALRAKILNPNSAGVVAGGRGPSVVIVKMQDGREIQGLRTKEDTF